MAYWEDLKQAIEGYKTGASLEDPLSNAFTETAIFEEGNYTIYSGIYSGYTDVLNQLIESIFLQKNELTESYIRTVRDAIGLLLFMSRSVANDLGQEAYIYQETTSRNIEFPVHSVVKQYTDSLYFSKEYLVSICEKHHYDYSIINEFILLPNNPKIVDDDLEINIVNFKPLIEVGNDILLYMPTAIPHVLVDYIYSKAKEQSSYNQLLGSLYVRQFHLSCVALNKMKWLATNIQLPELKTDLPIKETVFQFDYKKLAYVCFLETSKKIILGSKPTKEFAAKLYEVRAKEVVTYLANLDGDKSINVLCLYIIAETGEDLLFSWAKPSLGNYSIALTNRELATISNSEKVNSLTLWKFAKCYNRTSELTNLMSLFGTMDAYAIYIKNHGNLLDSDEANPIGGMLMIMHGSSDSFRREVQKQINEHSVLIYHEGEIGFAKVTRYKTYAPIYIERELSREFRIVIESYKMPIWITNYQNEIDVNGWASHACEAVAFWLHKMQKHLSPILNMLGFIQFELEIIVDKKLLTSDEYEIKDFPLEQIEIKIEIVPLRIKLNIPFEILYLIKLPNNEADKRLMKAALHSIKKYVEEASGKESELSEGIINEIIESTMQPSQAKMILFSDATGNVKLDSRNLHSLRYVQNSDVSYILDNLVSYLPTGYSIPEMIKDKDSKTKLCDDVVAAIIFQIESRLLQFDGKKLLELLIKQNEKCVQVREFREILIPAKIACFSNAESEIEQILDNEKNLVTTAHATRTLIEFVATKIPGGFKQPSYDDIDELLALTNQLTEWGALNESIRLGLDDPEMGLLPSGRIGTEKTLERNAFKPYAIAKTESEIFRNIENFEANYLYSLNGDELKETKESKELDEAFNAEFNISLTTLSEIVGTLINEGFTKANACTILEEGNIYQILTKVKGDTIGTITTALDLLSLIERSSIGDTPVGNYTKADIFPWHYNRRLSYLRRPIVKVKDNEKVYYYFGYRHLMAFTDNLFYLLYSSKLPKATTPLMKGWLASVSSDKGSPFRKKVAEWFEQETNFLIVPYEIKMDVNTSKAHIKTEIPLGDIDLMAIDHTNKIVYCIECKNISGGRNVHEMKVEMDEYLGRDGKTAKAKIYLHANRNLWLQKNKSSLSQFVPLIEEYTIKSLILTADEIPLVYLKKDSLPLPVKSFTFLRKKGTSYLEEKNN